MTNPSYSFINAAPNNQSGIAFDFSPYFERMATALETIATNSTTIATKISEIDTNTANMATYIHNLQTDLDTMAANSTIMTKLAQGLQELQTTVVATSGAVGQTVLTTDFGATANVALGQIVTGKGVPIGTSVFAFGDNSITLSNKLVSDATGSSYKFYKNWVGIHTINPYDWLGYASLYHLYVEQGKLIKDIPTNSSTAEQDDALELLLTYLTKIRSLPTIY